MDKQEFVSQHKELIDAHPYVYAWGIFCSSVWTWMLHELKQALLEQAPFDATYKVEGKWRQCPIGNENRIKLDAILYDYRMGNAVALYPINPLKEDNPPLVTLYQYNNQMVGFDLRKDFKAWIEQTQLFHAIVNDAKMGAEIRWTDKDKNLQSLQLNGRQINKAEDLPIELIKNFYLNSPYVGDTKQRQIQHEH